MTTVDIMVSATPRAPEAPPAVQIASAAHETAPVSLFDQDWPEDHGYAENDHTSVWIERVGEAEFV